MATRSAIPIETPRGLRAIYCHWDGYPSHHLPILQGRYGSARKAAALIAPGDISCLRTRSTWQSGPTLRDAYGIAVTDSAGFWRSEGDREAQPLYFAERGEADVAPRRFATVAALADWADGCGCEHVYVFRSRAGWMDAPLSLGPDGSAVAVPVAPGCDPAQW